MTNKNYRHSEETKRKISRALKGKKRKRNNSLAIGGGATAIAGTGLAVGSNLQAKNLEKSIGQYNNDLAKVARELKHRQKGLARGQDKAYSLMQETFSTELDPKYDSLSKAMQKNRERAIELEQELNAKGKVKLPKVLGGKKRKELDSLTTQLDQQQQELKVYKRQLKAKADKAEKFLTRLYPQGTDKIKARISALENSQSNLQSSIGKAQKGIKRLGKLAVVGKGLAATGALTAATAMALKARNRKKRR
jgi:hypothetical protein